MSGHSSTSSHHCSSNTILFRSIVTQPTIGQGWGLLKAPLVDFSVSKIFDPAKVPVILLAAEPRQHLSNMNVIFNSQHVYGDAEKLGKKRNGGNWLSNPHLSTNSSIDRQEQQTVSWVTNLNCEYIFLRRYCYWERRIGSLWWGLVTCWPTQLNRHNYGWLSMVPVEDRRWGPVLITLFNWD